MGWYWQVVTSPSLEWSKLALHNPLIPGMEAITVGMTQGLLPTTNIHLSASCLSPPYAHRPGEKFQMESWTSPSAY